MTIQVVLDTECYRNYWLCMFTRLDTGAVIYFEQFDGQDLNIAKMQEILTNPKYEFVDFNGSKYDLPMISLALAGASCELLKYASDALIVDGLQYWNFPKKFKCVDISINHIDLIEVAKGDCSLKLYAGRLHAKKMQDLPIEPDALISPEQREELRFYCRNDLDNTELLLNAHLREIAERRLMSEKYGIDLRSKSDAQIAEAVIKSEIEKITGERIRKQEIGYRSFYYEKPDYISFASEQLNTALEILNTHQFTIKENGVTEMPKALEELQITIGSTVYQMGMGGLHSTESERTVFSNDITGLLVDADVSSYYPSLMINNGISPPATGSAFMEVYRGIRDTRVHAKHMMAKIYSEIVEIEKSPVSVEGEKRLADLKREYSEYKTTSDLLKISSNGTFGKLGSPYSIFYAPKMMVQVTLTGQLSLLMLIEKLESLGISVISANTDGIVSQVLPNQRKLYDAVMKRWEQKTGLEMEFAEYTALYNRDVNAYIALKPDGKFKTKGFFSHAGISKNPQNEICLDALLAYLKDGTPFEKTVRECADIRKFVSVIRVTGGAVKGDEYLGKVVRFYYANNEYGCIQRKMNGNTVPRSTGAKPLMDLPDEFPTDINYEKYIKECRKFLWDLGIEPRPVPVKLPRRNTKAWKAMFAEGEVVEIEGEYCHRDDLTWR